MPIPFSTREGETAGIVFPLTQNDQPFPGGSSDHVEMVLSGFDGQSLGLLIIDPARVYFVDADHGLVIYMPGLGEIQHQFSPYRVYFRVFSDDLHYATIPAPPQYYLLSVEDNLL